MRECSSAEKDNKLSKCLHFIEMRLPGKHVKHSAIVANTSLKKMTDKPKQEKAERKYSKYHKPGYLARNCYKKSSCGKGLEGDAFMCTEKMQNKDL